jgi:hypothetical protein
MIFMMPLLERQDILKHFPFYEINKCDGYLENNNNNNNLYNENLYKNSANW